MMKPVAALALALSACLLAGTTFATDGHFGADRHVARGCHNTKQLVEKTKDVKPTNPHMSPHYQDTLECTNCHLQHDTPEDFCEQCHKFNFKVR